MSFFFRSRFSEWFIIVEVLFEFAAHCQQSVEVAAIAAAQSRQHIAAFNPDECVRLRHQSEHQHHLSPLREVIVEGRGCGEESERS